MTITTANNVKLSTERYLNMAMNGEPVCIVLPNGTELMLTKKENKDE